MASGISGTAVGQGASVTGGGSSTAVGQQATTTSDSSVAVGSAASAGNRSNAIGSSAVAAGTSSLAMGVTATTGAFNHAIAIGDGASAPGSNRGRVGTAAQPISWEGFGDLDWAGGYATELGPWTQDNVPAAQAAVALQLYGGTRTSRLVVRPGSILGIVVRSSEARTAGTLTVEATKNDVGTGLTATLDATNVTVKATVQAKDADAFAAGDEIGVTITTSADWAPTTADVTVEVLVEQ